jgi:lysylphosphatidylglycerol synthetase-like protein (DUF2156 family)
MFERLADFWDIVIFGFVLIMLASLQLRHASYAEGILALAVIICGVGLLLAKKWALIGTYIALLLGLVVYFAQIWYEPIMTGKGEYVIDNILKLLVVVLLLIYLGRTRIEQRFA